MIGFENTMIGSRTTQKHNRWQHTSIKGVVSIKIQKHYMERSSQFLLGSQLLFSWSKFLLKSCLLLTLWNTACCHTLCRHHLQAEIDIKFVTDYINKAEMKTLIKICGTKYLSVGTVAPSCVVLTVAPSCVVLNELSCSSTLCLFDVLAPSLLVPGGLPAFPFLSRLFP